MDINALWNEFNFMRSIRIIIDYPIYWLGPEDNLGQSQRKAQKSHFSDFDLHYVISWNKSTNPVIYNISSRPFKILQVNNQFHAKYHGYIERWFTVLRKSIYLNTVFRIKFVGLFINVKIFFLYIFF